MRTLFFTLLLTLTSVANAEVYLGLRSERTMGEGYSYGSFAGTWERVVLDITGQSFARVLSEAELLDQFETLESAYAAATANSEAARETLQTGDANGLTQLITTPNEAIGGLFLLDGFAGQVSELLAGSDFLIGQPVTFAVLVQASGETEDLETFGGTIDQYARNLQGALDNQVVAFAAGEFTDGISATYPLTSEDILMSLGPDPENTIVVTLKDGDVVIRMRDDVAPTHVARIKELAREGFYDGIVFHRVIEGFMAQTGDPTGTGTSGSGRNLNAEFSEAPFLRGTVGMARAQSPNSADSQFFIMFADGRFLDNNYTVIGQVESGMEYVDNIKRGEPPVDPDQMISVKVQADI